MANIKNILTVSAAKSLHGTPIAGTIETEWASKTSLVTRSHFNNTGFDFILQEPGQSLLELRKTLSSQHWDGVLVGWCIRGMSVDRTEIFEGVMQEVVDAAREQKDLKTMFCRGPTDLVGATLRNFPVDEVEARRSAGGWEGASSR